MKSIAYLLLFFLFLNFSCQSSKQDSADIVSTENEATSKIDSILINLWSTPDSLRTTEQRMTIDKIHRMVAKYVELKDGTFAFTLPKEKFEEETGLSIEYYDAIIKNIKENNSMADQMNFLEAEKDFNQEKKKWLNEHEAD